MDKIFDALFAAIVWFYRRKGTKPKDRQEEYLSQIINRLNEVFVTDQLTDKDMVNYAYTIRDKVGENILVMKQIENNSAEQALLGDFSKAIETPSSTAAQPTRTR